MYKLKGITLWELKGCVPQISLIKFSCFLVFIPFGIDFCSYGFYRGIFAPIAPNKSCSIYSFSLYSGRFQVWYWLCSFFVRQKQICSFMDFSQLIDQNIENFHVITLNGTAFGWKNYSFSPKEAPLKPSKKSLEICSLHTPNGRRLSFENPLE